MAPPFAPSPAEDSLAALLGARGDAQRRRRPPASRSTAAACRPDSASPCSRRHQLRPRRRHRHRQERQHGRRTCSRAISRSSKDGKPQTIENLQARQARRRRDADRRRPAAGHPHRLRRRVGSRARRRAAVRDFPGRLPRAPRGEPGVRAPLSQFVENAARPLGHDRPDVSARAGLVGADDAEPRRRHQGRPAVPRAASSTTRRRTSSRSSTRTTRPRRSSGSATRCRCRRSRRSSCTWAR